MGDDMQNEKSQSVPSKLECEIAVDRLNEAVCALRTAKQAVANRYAELHNIAKRYYKANPDLPRPIYYDYMDETAESVLPNTR